MRTQDRLLSFDEIITNREKSTRLGVNRGRQVVVLSFMPISEVKVLEETLVR